MKVTIKLDADWEFEAEIPDDVAEKLKKKEEVKCTGYERVQNGEQYFCANCILELEDMEETGHGWDDQIYECANYYTSEIVAENNARAEKLVRQLRRFAVEYREQDLDWTNSHQNKYYIYYDYDSNAICSAFNYKDCALGIIYFDSKEAANLAINKYRDELIWYFTEYKDSL